MDLRSITANRGPIGTSVALTSEEHEKLRSLKQRRIDLYLKDTRDHLTFQFHSEITSVQSHTDRIKRLIAVYDQQLSSGNAVIKNPYRNNPDLDAAQEYKKEIPDAPSLDTEQSTISTESNSIEHELRVGGRGNNSSRVALVVRPASPSLSRNFASTAESDENCSVGTQTDGSDIFELLNSAVLEVLAPDVELAARVIGHLYRLPAGLRSLIYGFVTHGDNDGRSSNTSSPNAKDGTDSQQTSSIVPSLISPNKKRQANQDGDGDPEDQKPRDKRNRDRSYHKATLRTPKYACLFNIKDPRKYCVVNEVGGTGDFYRSCMGAGWTELRGLLEHLRDHHLLAQCSRCWKIFDSQNEFDSHREGQGPECPDLSSMFWKREGVDPEKWGMIDEAFRTPKLKKQGNITRKSDFEKWMDVWNILFPKEVYPSLPRPTHPYYVDPKPAGTPSATNQETLRRITLARTIWNEKANMSNPDNSQKEFRPTLEQFEEIIREADAIISRSSPQISQPSQPSQPSLTFDQYEADRENEPLTDNTSSLPVALSLGSTSQGQPSLTPQATHDPDIYFDLIKRTKPSQNATQTSYQLTQESNSTSGPSNVSSSTQPPTPNSQCLLVPMPGRFPNTTSFIEFPDPAMQELPPIPSTWSQTPFTQGAPTLQTMPSQQPYPALPSSMSIPATPLANGVILNDCFYSYSDLAAVLQPQPGLPGNSTWQGGNNNAG